MSGASLTFGTTVADQNGRLSTVVVHRDLALKILALLLNEVGQNIDAPLIEGFDEMDAEWTALEPDYDLPLRVGVLRVDADVIGHGVSSRPGPAQVTPGHVRRSDDGMMKGSMRRAGVGNLRWVGTGSSIRAWGSVLFSIPTAAGGMVAPLDSYPMIHDGPSRVGARNVGFQPGDNAAAHVPEKPGMIA